MATSKDKSKLKAYIQQLEVNLKAHFDNQALLSSDKDKYDGGLTAIIIYYNNKYKLGISFAKDLDKLSNFNEISLKIYKGKEITIEDDTEDLLGNPIIRKYYINGEYVPFRQTWIDFKSSKKNKDKNGNGEIVWVQQMNEIILAFIALKNNYKLGFTNKKDFMAHQNEFDNILDEYLEKYMRMSELNDQYILTTWVIGIYLENTSKKNKLFENLREEMVIKLLQKRLNSKSMLWWGKNNSDMMRNWISYGIIRDHLYLGDKVVDFLQRYNLEELINKTKEIDVNDVNEGFESRLERAYKKKKVQSRKTDNYPQWKMYLGWMCFIILIYISIRVFMYMSSKLFSLKMINE